MRMLVSVLVLASCLAAVSAGTWTIVDRDLYPGLHHPLLYYRLLPSLCVIFWYVTYLCWGCLSGVYSFDWYLSY
jgi:hypothetical protein